jgi:threonine dehydrogenase-like Zn-dependent dehydrogenase
MKGLWLEDGVLSYQEDISQPSLTADEALVRVSLAGVCRTDQELVGGYYPFRGVLGHEFVGRIVEAPADSSRVGQRVVGEINAVCGDCSFCTAGLPSHCSQRTVLGIVGRNGAFAEFLSLPLKNLLPIPESVSDESAVFVEPLAAALQIAEQVHISPSESVLLIGAGKLGQLIARSLVAMGINLSVIARHESQKRPLSALGKSIDLIEEEHCPEKTIDVVIEATGSERGFWLASKAARPRGTIVLKSTYRGRPAVDFSQIVVDEITLIGSRCGPFDAAIRFLARRRVDTSPLIEERFPLEMGLRAFKVAARRGALKVLLEI